MLASEFFNCDISICTLHIYQNLPVNKPFEYPDDVRLTSLESTFVNCLQDLKSQGRVKEFLTNKMFQGLLMITASNVDCRRYLLTEENFKFVLTRKLSSDAIGSFFRWLRRSTGSTGQMNMRAEERATQTEMSH